VAAYAFAVMRWSQDLPRAHEGEEQTPMTDIAAPAKPTALKTITTKHLAYTLAEQHQLTKKHGQQMVEDLVGLIIEPVPSENVIRKSIGTISCPFRKFHPAQIRIVRQNHRIIESDVCNPARAWNVRRGSIQVADPA
jgi:hypothetical protein